MARSESSQQIDLQQGTVYSLEMKWLEHTQKKQKKFAVIQSCTSALQAFKCILMPLHNVHVFSIPHL